MNLQVLSSKALKLSNRLGITEKKILIIIYAEYNIVSIYI